MKMRTGNTMSHEIKKAVKPKLCFPKFKDAPEWEEAKFGDIAEILQGYGFPEKYQGKSEGEYPFYKVSDISNSLQNGKIFINEANNYIDAKVIKELKAKVIPIGTTIFAKIGEAIRSNRRTITTKLCLIDNNVAGIKRIEGKSLDFFVYYLLSEINLVDYAGGVVPAVNKSAIENITVVFPSLEEQQKIADCLSSLDELITAQAQKLESLEVYKKGLMQQLFPSDGETIPKLRFLEFRDAGEWEEKTLGKVAENLDNRRVPITEGDRFKGKIPYYGASGIVDYVKDFIFDEELLCISEDGANLVARTYPIAFPISGKTWVNNHAHVLRFANPATQKIIENYLNSIKLDDFLTGMAQPKLNKAMLDSIPILLPSINEQQKIADCLSSLDELITAQKQKLETLKTHKKGLMQQLFPQISEGTE
jgi:type I restriction enzyme, S subunit